MTLLITTFYAINLNLCALDRQNGLNLTLVIEVNWSILEKTYSDSAAVTCGVPQGSILGTLLFLCYVNDMVLSIDTDCKLLLYTHDSKILFSHSYPDQIANKLRKNLESCSALLVDNKLSLHLGKTECILFGPKCKLKKVKNFIKVSEYDQEIPNSQTVDNPMAP